MRSIRYERRRVSPEMARWGALMAEDNSGELTFIRSKLAKALAEEVTPRQREVLALYYQGQLTLDQIGRRLGISTSTVSRTLRRGEKRLRRCLRYGSPALLDAAPPESQRRQCAKKPTE